MSHRNASPKMTTIVVRMATKGRHSGLYEATTAISEELTGLETEERLRFEDGVRGSEDLKRGRVFLMICCTSSFSSIDLLGL